MATPETKCKQPSKPEYNDLQKFIKHLGLKGIQIIVQSRLGKKNATRSKPDSFGTDWFNLALKDCPEVLAESKKAIGDNIPNQNQSLCIEISLKTVENSSLVLEIWKLYLTDAITPNQPHYVYSRMSLILKSLMCITKITPAYKFSCLQGPDSYVICYRIFMGEPDTKVLGEHVENFKVGFVSTPVGGVGISLSYRTVLTIDPQPITPPLLVTSNYFDNRANALKHTDEPDCNQNDAHSCEKLAEEMTNSRSRLNTTCLPSEYEGSTIWENSRIGAFVPTLEPPKLEDCLIPETPFNLLLQGAASQSQAPDLNNNSGSNSTTREQPLTIGKDRDSDESDADVGEDFVLIDLKPPFAEAEYNSLGTFFNELPPLVAFSQPTERSLEDQVCEINTQLQDLEMSCSALDNFVESLCQLDETS